MLTIVVTYANGATEQIEGATTQWDLRRDGRLSAWNDSDEVVAERDGVESAAPGPLAG